MRYTPTGTAVASCGIATNRRFKQGEDLKEEVMYMDLVLFGKAAENFAQYCSKGDPVLVSGRIQQRRWETDDGAKHSKHELVVETWKTLKRREGSGDADGGAQ
ncbi:MAG: single-stranded DNA-binding protein [Candidatus Krumholzibacteria bacterium]|nr:single-stranded DNA-binding protein [Candidatus Krumholzibacteria bacterium]